MESHLIPEAMEVHWWSDDCARQVVSAVFVLEGGNVPFSSILRMIFTPYFSETSHVW